MLSWHLISSPLLDNTNPLSLVITRMMNDALVEVDGLFTGLIYLDATDPPLPKRTSKNWFQNSLTAKLDVIYNARETRPETDTSDAPSSTIDEGILARDAAWSSIRTIRDGMQILWDHFVDASRVLNTPTIASLRKRYHDAQGLCCAGVFAFRHTVIDQKPGDLVRVFAFCSLSYVVTHIFCAQKRAKKTDLPAGIRSWRDALKGEDERQAFDALTIQMWPEAQDHVHFQELGPRQPLSRSTSTHGHSGSAPPVSATHYKCSIQPFPIDFSSTQPFDSGQLGQGLSSIMGESLVPLQDKWRDNDQVNNSTTNTSTAFGQNPQSFTDPTNDTLYYTVPNAQTPVFNNGPSSDSFAWSDSGSMLDMMEPLDWTAFEDLANQSASYTELVTNCTQGLSDTALPETTTCDSALQKTSTFMVVREYIRDNCDFWRRLAGSGLVSKDHGSRSSWWETPPSRKECRQTLAYIQQLRAVEHTRDPESRGIVAVAEAYIRWGFLQSVEDTKLYMAKLGDLLFDTETNREDFCRWIRGFSGDNEKPLACPYCSHRDKYEGNLRRHIKNKHRVEYERSKQKMEAPRP